MLQQSRLDITSPISKLISCVMCFWVDLINPKSQSGMVRRCFDHGHASINLHEFLTSANGFIKMVSSGGLNAEKCEIWYGPQTQFFILRDRGILVAPGFCPASGVTFSCGRKNSKTTSQFFLKF